MKHPARILAGMATAVLLAVGVMAQKAPELPDTRPGRLMSEWLKLCDGADVAAMTRWGEQNLVERILERIGAGVVARRQARDCRANGGYELVAVLDSQPLQLDISTRARKTGSYIQMRMSVTPPGKAQVVGTMPMTPPLAALPSDLTDKNMAAWLNGRAEALAKAEQFSGIAVVARGSRPVAVASVGYADRARKTPITPQTQFTIGSMGKMFTAVALGQLVDRGRLSFDDRVGKFFPQFANQSVREKVTVAMLLSHTSGMADFLGRRTPAMMKSGVRRAEEFVPLLEHDEPQFEPGTRWSYSNAGLALAGAIVERVSGEDYPTYIRRHVFAVAGMTGSDPNNVPRLGPRLVTPYTEAQNPDSNERWREAPRDIGSPAGGAISTAADLVKFADALRSGKLISPATLARMAEGRPTPALREYGMGMEVEKIYGRTVVGHGGGFPGVSTELYILLGSSYTGVVLANQDPPAAGLLGGWVKALVIRGA